MLQIFNYQDTQITFKKDDGTLMVNATEMAKPFKKQPKDWLRTKYSEEFMSSLSDVRQISLTELVKITQGGNGVQGTWLHEDVALEFARWLSPTFAIWCNDRIKELIQHGFTATDRKIEELIANPDLVIELATALKTERQERMLAQEQALNQTIRANKAENYIEEIKPKVLYHDSVLQSDSLFSVTTIAKELGMSGKTLNEELKRRGVQYKISTGQWLLYAQYQNKGFTGVDTELLGNGKTIHTTKWTEKGRQFILKFIRQPRMADGYLFQE